MVEVCRRGGSGDRHHSGDPRVVFTEKHRGARLFGAMENRCTKVTLSLHHERFIANLQQQNSSPVVLHFGKSIGFVRLLLALVLDASWLACPVCFCVFYSSGAGVFRDEVGTQQVFRTSGGRRTDLLTLTVDG